MRNLKRALSLVMAMALIVGMMVISASAAGKDFTDMDEIDHVEAVEVMTALNVISGKEDGSYYDPTGSLTRAEMAKIVAYVMNGGVEPNIGTKLIPTYSDIDGHWAEAYIEYCTSMGIIAGDGAGKFNPEGTLTGEQAAKMFLTAMGYNANVFGFTGNDWAINVGRYANEAGLYKQLGDIAPSAVISRDDAAQMAYNALQGTMMKRTWSQDLTTGQLTETYAPWTSEDEHGVSYPVTLLGQKFDGAIRHAYLESFSYDSVKSLWTYTFDKGDFDDFGGNVIASNFVEDDLTSADDYTDLYGQRVKVIYNVKDSDVIYGVYASDSSVVASGATGNISVSNAADDSVSVSGEDYRLGAAASAIEVYDFNEGDSHESLASLDDDVNDLSAYTFKMVDNTGDGKIDVVIRVPMVIAKINYVGKDQIQFNNTVGASDIEDLVTYDGYAAGDWVCYVDSLNTKTEIDTIEKIELKTATVDGARGTADGYTQYQIDGQWLTATTAPAYGTIPNLEVGDTIEYVSLGSTLFYAKITEIGATSQNLAMVISVGKDGEVTGISTDVLKVKLLFADGGTATGTITRMENVEVTTSNMSAGTEFNGQDAETYADSLVGKLVTYREDGSDYQLMAVGDNNEAGYLNYVDGADATAAGAKNGYDDGVVNGYELADDAVVFFLGGSVGTAAATNKADVYTGAELKNAWSDDDKSILADANEAQVLTQEINGFTYAKVVTLADTSLPEVIGGSNYGYLTAVTHRTVVDGDYYLNYTIRTPDGVLEVQEKNPDPSADYPKGAVVTFDVVSKTEVENVTVVTNLTTGKVTGWDEVSKIALDGKVSEVDANDTVILYIDSENRVGMEGGTIQKWADENGNGVAEASEPDNVRYLLSTDGKTVVLLVVDINNEMVAGPALKLGGTATAADIARAFGSADAVTITGTYTPAASASITVPQGKTLTINGNLAMDNSATVTVNGTLSISGKITGTNHANVTIGATGHLIYGGEASATIVDDFEAHSTAGAKLTLKVATSASAAINKWYTTYGTAVVEGSGTAATPVTVSTAVPAGTYVYGTYGYDGSDDTTPSITGWFKQA